LVLAIHPYFGFLIYIGRRSF